MVFKNELQIKFVFTDYDLYQDMINNYLIIEDFSKSIRAC